LKLNRHKAPNYLLKIHKCDIAADGSWCVEDRSKYFSDVQLQFEAEHWAKLFNKKHPKKQIQFIDCFVIELFERPGFPILGCERFVDGHDTYGKVIWDMNNFSFQHLLQSLLNYVGICEAQ